MRGVLSQHHAFFVKNKTVFKTYVSGKKKQTYLN